MRFIGISATIPNASDLSKWLESAVHPASAFSYVNCS
jgi:replicative superfamily II helicase